MSTQQHLKILGWLYVALAALNIVMAVAVVATLTIEGSLSGDAREVLDAITSDIRAAVASLSLLAAVPQSLGGLGLLTRKSWSWILVWTLACLSLMGFPIGTAAGVYSLWVLTRPDTQQILGAGPHVSLMKKGIKIIFVLSLVFIGASFPACYVSEGILQTELSKLSPAEKELRQFDMVYLRWALPGVLMFLYGVMLAFVGIATWIYERRWVGRKQVPMLNLDNSTAR